MIEITTTSGPGRIRVVDNGSGMSAEEVERSWLRIGFSGKTANKKTKGGRRVTGEKGVGRLSADRLGSNLRMRTVREGERPLEVRVCWDDFDVDDRALEEVSVEFDEPSAVDLPSRSGPALSGTELTITGLRQVWGIADLDALERELAILVPPFEEARTDFEIELQSDIPGAPNGTVTPLFLHSALLDMKASFDGAEFEWAIRRREDDPEGGQREASGKLPWDQLIQRIGRWRSREHAKPSLGRVALRLLFYPRRQSLVAGTSFSLSELREFLDSNAGVRIYRDNIRVRPYGDPGSSEGDWLRLGDRKARDPAGPSRLDFKVSPTQIVGAILIGRDQNPDLRDSASREGLVQNDAFSLLRDVVLGAITLLEVEYHKTFSTSNQRATVLRPSEQMRRLRGDLDSLRDELTSISAVPMKEKVRFAEAIDEVAFVGVRLEEASAALKDLVSQTTVFRGLASVGIAAAVFAHETQAAIDQVTGSLQVARASLEERSSHDLAKREIGKAIKYASQVAAWGAFALARVRRDKRTRRKLDLRTLVESIVEDLRPALEASEIRVDILPSENLIVRTFAMDVESILLNLLTNAFTACQQAEGRRVIEVALEKGALGGRESFRVCVADSGPGVALDLLDRVWDPLFSTKVGNRKRPTGTGLGLSIVQSIVDDLGGRRSVDSQTNLGGARFCVELPAF